MNHHNVASALSWHGLRAESAYVIRMAAQRAELLEALKVAHRHMNGGRDMLNPMEFHEWFQKISEIITKVEANQ